MKFLIRMFLLPCLFLWLTSCAPRPKYSSMPKAESKPVVTARVDTSRRRIGLPEEEGLVKEVKGSRRRPPILSDIDEVPDIEKKDEIKPGIDRAPGDESVAIFEPYDPEKAREEVFRVDEEALPEEIREEILGLKEEEEYVTLNFEQAPIEQILNAVSETLGINFIMSPGAKGSITMQTSKPVPASELFQILQSVLEVNQLTLIPSGRYYKLVAGKEAKQYPIRVLSGKEGEKLLPEDSFITQIIPLDYIPVKDMQSILQSFLSKSAPPMIQHEELNILIINDLSSNMKRLLRFVQELDKPLYQPKEKVYVYYVENSDAEKLASTLNSIYKEQDRTKRFPYSPLTGEKLPEQPQQPQLQPQQLIQTPFGPMMAPQEQVSGEVRITADKEINALIIVTSPRNYPAVLETIKKLDIMPKQVLIEALILDITLTDATSFGLGWFLKGNEQSLGFDFSEGPAIQGRPSIPNRDNFLGTTFEGGFGYKLITDSSHFMAIMNMLSNITTLNVISSPYIMALDNKKATINILTEYEIQKTVRYAETGESVTEPIYKDVGLKLDVTPKINENNVLTLELNQEVSERTGEGNYVKRNVTSTVLVKDGQTIIIGGLIRESKNKTKSGIPFFSDIPLIGKFFGNTTDTLDKTELILLLTPRVVTTQDEAEKLTSEYENKVESLKEMLAGVKEEGK